MNSRIARWGCWTMEATGKEVIGCRRVLLAHQAWPRDRRWYGDIDEAFAPVGLLACRAHTGGEAVRCVEQGGLAGAVLVSDERHIDGLSILRIIRSIDDRLPCWLVADGLTRWTLQEALALRVASVIVASVAPDELAVTLRKRLAGPN
jgi:hypothetical protein